VGTPVAVVHLGKDDVCTLRKRRSMACRERTSSGEGREASSFEEKRGGGKAAVSCRERGRRTPGGTLRARRRQASVISTYGRKTHADFPRLPAPAGVRLVAGVILFRGYTALGRSGVRRLEQSRISSDPSQAVDKCSTAAK
jgi:hypothetical protein